MSREFGHGFGSFGDGVFGQFTGENQFDGGLNFSGRESVLLVVSNQFGSFHSESVERVRDEGVQDRHSFLGDSDFGVNLFQDFVNIDSERFDSSLGSLDGGFGDGSLGGCSFLGDHFKFLIQIR